MWRSRTAAEIYIYIYVSEDFLSKVRFLIRVQTEAESFSCLSALTDTFEQQHTSKKPLIYYLGTFHSIHRVNYQISTWNLFSTDINFKSGERIVAPLWSWCVVFCLVLFFFQGGHQFCLIWVAHLQKQTNKTKQNESVSHIWWKRAIWCCWGVAPLLGELLAERWAPSGRCSITLQILHWPLNFWLFANLAQLHPDDTKPL